MKDRFIKLGFSSLLLAIFFVPLSFAMIWPDISIFELDKLLVLRLFLFLSFLFLVLSGKKLSLSKAFIAPAIFLFISFLISLTAFNQYNSFFGSYLRQFGFFTQFSLVSIVFLVWAYRDQFNFLEKVLGSLFFSASFVAIYGILQYLNLDIYTWAEPAYLTGRITSALGQANFLASFLLLSIFSGFYLLHLRCRDKWYRVVYFLALLIQVIALFLTASRGAWLGFIFGIFLLLIFYSRQLSKKAMVSVMASFLLLIGVAFCFPGFRNRFISIFDFNSGSVAIRLQIWNDVIDNYSDKMLFGWGLNNGQEFFVRHYNTDGALFAPVNSLNDKAHNFVMDWFMEGGVLLLLAGLYLLFIVFKKVIKTWKDDVSSVYLGTAIGAYLFSLLFSFEFMAGAMIFWLFVGLILSTKERDITFSESKILKYFLLLASLILLLWSAWAKYSDVNGLRMNYVLGQSDYHKAGNYYLLANNNRKHISQYDFMMTEGLMANTSVDRDAFAGAMSSLWQRGVSLSNDNNVYSLINSGRAKMLLADYTGAQETFKDLTIKFSKWPIVWELYARAALASGDSEEAFLGISAAEELLPDLNDERISLESRQILVNYYSQLSILRAEVYLANDNYEEAIVAYKRALSYNLNIGLYKNIADSYFLLGDMTSSRYYLQRAMILDSANYSWPFALALSYKISGDDHLFKEFLNKALLLSPDNPELVVWQDTIKD